MKEMKIREAITEVYTFQKNYREVFFYWAGYVRCLVDWGVISEDDGAFYDKHNVDEYWRFTAKLQ